MDHVDALFFGFHRLHDLTGAVRRVVVYNDGFILVTQAHNLGQEIGDVLYLVIGTDYNDAFHAVRPRRAPMSPMIVMQRCLDIQHPVTRPPPSDVRLIYDMRALWNVRRPSILFGPSILWMIDSTR